MIIINGKPYKGNSISVFGNNTILIDGVRIDEVAENGIVEVRITEGSPVSVMSEVSVTCGAVNGPVEARMGVVCGDVHGNVRAGMSVNCGYVTGDVDAGMSVTTLGKPKETTR